MEKKVKIVSTIYFIVVAIIVFTSDNVKLFATALDYIACGSATGIPKPIPQVITIGYTLLMVGTPIVLITSSIITLVKAIVESDQEKILKARNVLVRKAILAVLVFFTASIVRFISSKVASTADDKSTVAKCLNCFIYYNNNDCRPSKIDAHSEDGTYNENYGDVSTYTGGTKPHGEKTILIGDSRTVGICGSTSRTAVTDCRDGVLAVRQGAASNTGAHDRFGWGVWFDNEAIPAVTTYVKEHQSTIFNIVILMGVNDLGLTAEQASDNYIADIERMANGDWKRHSIVFVSAGPIKPGTSYGIGGCVTQSKIDEFNRLMGEKIKNKNFHNVTYCDIVDKVEWLFPSNDNVHYSYPNGNTNYFNGIMDNCGLKN